MKKHHIIISAILLLSAVSCLRKPAQQKSTTEFVREIISDEDNPYNAMLSGVKASADGEICLIGSETAVRSLAQVFLDADDRDNIDGYHASDGLSDFAGETICCIEDSLFYPYHRFIEQNKETELRNLAVRYAINAADTVSHVNIYDEKGSLRRERAKIIVFADPYLVQNGLHDADTLLASFGCEIPVVSPMDLMYEEVLDAGCRNIGVLCQKSYSASGIYSGRFRNLARSRGVEGYDCVVYPVNEDDSEGLLHYFLDKYIASGFTRPLDAIVIDCHSVNPEKVSAELVDIISPLSADSAKYGKYISDGFRLLESGSSLKKYCYEHLRSTNRFTHRIRKPMVREYHTYPGTGVRENETILISSDSYVQN